MAIYKTDGTRIDKAYSANGSDLLKAYELDGSENFYSIKNAQNYFESEAASVANAVNALSDDWQSFIHITDPHGAGNKQHSQAIALYLLSNSKVSMLVLGGDYSNHNWYKSEYDTFMTPFRNSIYTNKIYAIFGNHETYNGGTEEAKQCIYNDFLKNKNNISGSPSNIYYYFDDANKKTRYMFINTSDKAELAMSDAQITWIGNNVILPSTDWSLVVIGHVTLATMGGVTYQNESNGSDVIAAIKKCNGKIVGYICGHQHVDICENISGIQHTTLICDKFENNNYYDGISVTNRVAGTDSEQAVSVVSINTKTKNVVVRRIGAGRNRTISYSYS